VYLLGSQNRSQYEFSIGKDTQRNQPHFIELYAGLVARNFLLNPPPLDKKVVLISREGEKAVKWLDLPERMEIQDNIINGVRFAYIWLANILPELRLAREIGNQTIIKGAPWIDEFYRPIHGFLGKLLGNRGDDLPEFSEQNEKNTIELITAWCEDYLRWIIEIHSCDGDEVNLFQITYLKTFDGEIGGERLKELVIDDPRDEDRKKKDEIQRIKEKLHPRVLESDLKETGTVGLAKVLYYLSQQQWKGEI
jgi:hypothetical protein